MVVTCLPCSAHARTPSRASARASQSLKDVSIGDVLFLGDVFISDAFCPRDVFPEICCYWSYLFLRYVSIVDDLFLRNVSIGNVLFLRDVSIAGVLFLRDF